MLLARPPGKSPRPLKPVCCVQRKAWAPDEELLLPTMMLPSQDAPFALLKKLPPGRSPKPYAIFESPAERFVTIAGSRYSDRHFAVRRHSSGIADEFAARSALPLPALERWISKLPVRSRNPQPVRHVSSLRSPARADAVRCA